MRPVAENSLDATASFEPPAVNRWLLVTDAVKRVGGQERANLELVRYLSLVKAYDVHLVTHDVDAFVNDWQGVRVHLVRSPFGSNFLGERLLQAKATSVRASLGPGTIVVTNGGNFLRGDVVWVHCVHSAWPVSDQGAPIHRRALNRLKKWDARIREAEAVRYATLAITNSAKTARELQECTAIAPDRIRVLYFGSDPHRAPSKARQHRPQLAFVGALGWERNKGIDVALQALALLSRDPSFAHRLVVAGAGSSAPSKRLAQQLGIADRVEFLGLCNDVPALLAESDLLISPSVYEAYGLAVHEALVAGLPAIVSADAGITERFPPEFAPLLVPDKRNPHAWAEAIAAALNNLPAIRSHVNEFRHVLRSRTWEDMAREFVEFVLLGLAERRPASRG